MLVQNNYNRRIREYNRIHDIYEDNIKPNKLNITPFEYRLMNINKGIKRRLANNHAQRLAKFKASH